ncbi:uncharacterized protein [Hyperolius riggenbachi]|uniref:uncharacterized protein isoform X2 n=1 Tax=Hyperolius riggenbachi TaxID=752182 RepID=UPI0035A2C20C
MPKCIVDYCRNYDEMKRNYSNIILHCFPPNLEDIRIWLKSLQENGQCFQDIEATAENIHAGKKSDLFRVCSEHFAQECYDYSGEKKTLRKDAVPTVFCKHKQVLTCPMRRNSVRRQEHLIRQHCVVVKKTTGEHVTADTCRCKPEGLQTGAHWMDEGHEKDIVQMAHKITELLTGEVPIRCDDVTVYFSMEEWQYVAGHKDLYKDVMKEEQHPAELWGNPWTEGVSSSDHPNLHRSNNADSPNTAVVSDQNQETQTVATKCLTENVPTLPVSAPSIEKPCSSYDFNSKSTWCSPASPTLAMSAPFIKDPCSSEGLDYQSETCSSASCILPVPAPTVEESYTHDGWNARISGYPPSGPSLLVSATTKKEFHTPENLNARSNTCPLEGPTLPLSPPALQEPLVCDSLYVKTTTCPPPGSMLPVSACTVEEASSPDAGYPSPMEYTNTFQVNTPLSFKEVNQLVLHTTYSSFSDQEGPECQEEQSSFSMHGKEDSGLPVIISSHCPSAQVEVASHPWEEEYLPPSTLPEPTEFCLSHVKQEPQSSEEEDLLYGKSIGGTLYTSVQVKEEPDLCAGENLPNWPTCTSTSASVTIKVEPHSWEEGNLHNSGNYTPMDPARYTSVTIKQEPSSCEEDSLLKTEWLPTFCHVKEETHSDGGEDLTDQHLEEKMEVSADTNDDSAMGLNDPSIRVTDLETDISAKSLNLEYGALTPTSSNTPAAQSDSKNIVLLQLHISPVLQSQMLKIPTSPTLAAGQAKGPVGDISNLTKYWRDHSKRKVPQCSECGKLFLKPKQLREHQVTHTTQLPFRCADCGKAFKNNYQCIIHQRQTHPKPQWNIDMKTDWKPHICSKCGKMFSEKQTLNQHQYSQCLMETFECPFCNVHFKQKVQLHLHEQRHMGIASREPKFSSSLTKNRETAGQHWDILQVEACEGKAYSEELSMDNVDGSLYSCTECKKHFVKRTHLLEHKKMHQMDSLFLCSYCSHSCSSKEALHIHEKTHLSHECLYCGRWFHNKVTLANHQKTHANQKMHKCLECGRVFSKRSALVVHQSSHARKRVPPSSSDCS